MFDEAESHLHWDAQADLINVLYHQDMVSQVVYSTHSPGCLPHDLGHGVRAVIPTKPDRSKVENWIWATAAGFRPMLTHMGASSAALTPHRYAVATEGVADFILLPSLLREATGEDALPYQVVPGLAQLSGDGFRTIDSESDKMVYLTDGDDGGRGILSSLHRSGIPATRTFSLPTDVALEDLVSSETLAAAALEELRRSGHELYAPPVFPSTGRSSYLDGWCAEAGVKPPTKRAIACRVLELTARNPQAKRRWPLLEESHRTALFRSPPLVLGRVLGTVVGRWPWGVPVVQERQPLWIRAWTVPAHQSVRLLTCGYAIVRQPRRDRLAFAESCAWCQFA